MALRAHEGRVVPVAGRALLPAELRGQEDLLARHALCEDFADERLGVAAAIGVSRVPVRDAAVVGLDQRLLRQPVVVTAPADRGPLVRVRSAVAPGPEADRGDMNIRAAKADRAHGRGL